MDPVDQLYTLDELRCWKVENLRQFLTMRGLTKSGTKSKEELAALCFSACKLNLPLVPSQDDVLKDSKRCYDNILSECGITDPFRFILVGLMNRVILKSARDSPEQPGYWK
jgi:hypothetical protein